MKQLLCFVVPVFSFAADTDIVPRSINFIIFIAILSYFASNYIKLLLATRVNTFQNKLETIEKDLRLAREQKENASKQLTLSTNEARDFLINAGKSVEKEKQQILDKARSDCKILEKNYQEECAYMASKIQESVVVEVVEREVLCYINLRDNELLKIAEKKAS